MRPETPDIIRVLALYPELKASGVPLEKVAEQCAMRLPERLPSDTSPSELAERACEALLLRLSAPERPVGAAVANYVVGAFRQIGHRAYHGEPRPSSGRMRQASFVADTSAEIAVAECQLAAGRAEIAQRPRVDPQRVASAFAAAAASMPPRPPYGGAPLRPWQPLPLRQRAVCEDCEPGQPMRLDDVIPDEVDMGALVESELQQAGR